MSKLEVSSGVYVSPVPGELLELLASPAVAVVTEP